MVITMTAMGMMQMPIDQVIGVIAMGDGGVTATGTMDMAGGMAPAGMVLGAAIRIGRAYGDGMLLDHFPFLVVEVAIVDIVDMPIMFDRGVATAGTMNVVMVIVVFAAFRHERIPWEDEGHGYSVTRRNRARKTPFSNFPFSYPRTKREPPKCRRYQKPDPIIGMVFPGGKIPPKGNLTFPEIRGPFGGSCL